MRSKKSTFRVQQVHFLGAPHLPKIDPGYGPVLGHDLHPFILNIAQDSGSLRHYRQNLYSWCHLP